MTIHYFGRPGEWRPLVGETINQLHCILRLSHLSVAVPPPPGAVLVRRRNYARISYERQLGLRGLSGERVLGDVHGLPSPSLGQGGIIHRSAVSSVRAMSLPLSPLSVSCYSPSLSPPSSLGRPGGRRGRWRRVVLLPKLHVCRDGTYGIFLPRCRSLERDTYPMVWYGSKDFSRRNDIMPAMTVVNCYIE